MPAKGERYEVLRGAPTRTTGHMERLHRAWIDALAAAAGCEVWSEGVLDDGVDVGLRHKHPDHPRSPALIDLQLKATTVAPSGGFARAKMTRKRALEMSEADPTVSMVVAVLTMSAVQPHWTFTNQRSLVLFGRCYWVNLAGLVVPAGEPNDKVTVKAPVEQVLDDVALARMMERVGRGDPP